MVNRLCNELLWKLSLLSYAISFYQTPKVFCYPFSNYQPKSLTCRVYSTNRRKYHHYPNSLFSTKNNDIVTSFPVKRDKTSSVENIIIVGGGVGGLAIASRIASSPNLPSSTKITLLEKNGPELIGGRCGSFYVDVPNVGRFRHERGPSLLLLKNEYLNLFQDCGGASAEDFGLEIKQCVPGYQVVFEDGDSIQLGFPSQVYKSDNETLKNLAEKSRKKMDEIEEDGAMKWDSYMRATGAFLDCGLPNFIEERVDLKSFPAFLVEALRDGLKSWPLKPHSDVLDSLFSSNKMKVLASFQNLYVGLEPYRNKKQFGGGVIRKTAPAVFGLLAALELHPTNEKSGVFAPIGGFQAVSEALQNLAVDCGVEIMYEKTVTKVSKDGVSFLNGNSGTQHFLPGDFIIVNADLPFATKSLLSNDSKGVLNNNEDNREDHSILRYDWDDKFDFSSGVIAFHWSINKTCDQLNTHNVFLVGSSRSVMEKSWRAVRTNIKEEDAFENEDYPFNFYVHRAGAVDKTAAPQNCDAIMVLVPCSSLQHNAELAKLPRDQCIAGYEKTFDETYLSKVRDAVLARLGALEGLKDLRKDIVSEAVDTPCSYANLYNVAAGTPFALSHGFGQLSITRPGYQSKESDNILYVGASSRPGNGVPLVLIGAKLVANKLLEKIKNFN